MLNGVRIGDVALVQRRTLDGMLPMSKDQDRK
jgi:hypothetical protein